MCMMSIRRGLDTLNEIQPKTEYDYSGTRSVYCNRSNLESISEPEWEWFAHVADRVTISLPWILSPWLLSHHFIVIILRRDLSCIFHTNVCVHEIMYQTSLFRYIFSDSEFYVILQAFMELLRLVLHCDNNNHDHFWNTVMTTYEM